MLTDENKQPSSVEKRYKRYKRRERKRETTKDMWVLLLLLLRPGHDDPITQASLSSQTDWQLGNRPAPDRTRSYGEDWRNPAGHLDL